MSQLPRKPLFETVEPVIRSTGHAASAPPLPVAARGTTSSGTGRMLDRVDWARRRMPISPLENTLHRAAEAWLKSLPDPLVPRELARRYPRIANRLARLWENEPACRAYLDDLRIDWRTGRQGFPGGIPQELNALHAYHERLCAAAAENLARKPKRDVWEHEPDRSARTTTIMATTMLSPWRDTTRFSR